MILRLHMTSRYTGSHFRLMEYPGEIQPFGFPMIDAVFHVEQIAASDQIVEFAYADLRHQFAHLFGNEKEIVHHVFWLAGEFPAQNRILCRNADRTGIEVALAHHDAAFYHQRRGGETELVGTQQCTD